MAVHLSPRVSRQARVRCRPSRRFEQPRGIELRGVSHTLPRARSRPGRGAGAIELTDRSRRRSWRFSGRAAAARSTLLRHHQRPAGADARARCSLGGELAGAGAAAARDRLAGPGRRPAAVARVVDNVALAAARWRRRKRVDAGRSGELLDASAWRTARGSIRTSCRAACASGPRWRGRWSRGRRSCCWTSRSRTWTS